MNVVAWTPIILFCFAMLSYISSIIFCESFCKSASISKANLACSSLLLSSKCFYRSFAVQFWGNPQCFGYVAVFLGWICFLICDSGDINGHPFFKISFMLFSYCQKPWICFLVYLCSGVSHVKPSISSNRMSWSVKKGHMISLLLILRPLVKAASRFFSIY